MYYWCIKFTLKFSATLLTSFPFIESSERVRETLRRSETRSTTYVRTFSIPSARSLDNGLNRKGKSVDGWRMEAEGGRKLGKVDSELPAARLQLLFLIPSIVSSMIHVQSYFYW